MNKKIVVLNIVVVATLIFTGCLKTKVKDTFYAGDYYKTDGDFISANLGVYAMLAQDGLYGRYLNMDFDWGSDEIVCSRQINSRDVLFYNYDATDPKINTSWTQLYNAIGRSNSFLDNSFRLSDSLKFYEAEVRFLRGYFYFLLAQQWGSVPVRGTALTSISTTTNIHFQPVDSVYLFALNDMLTAYPNLLAKTDVRATSGRINKMVCAGILARVYLHIAGYCYDQKNPGYTNKVKGKYFEAQLKNTSAQEFFKEAVKWTDTVMQKGNYSLTTNYKDIFIAEAQDSYTPEVMWEVEFYGNRAGAYADYYTAGRVGIINGLYGVGGACYGFLTPYVIKHYDTVNDLRYKRNMSNSTDNMPDDRLSIENKPGTNMNSVATYGLGKWRRLDEKLIPYDKNYNATNFPLLRYADILLMHAEAVNELALQYGENSSTESSVTNDLTAIRIRAGLSYASNIPAVGTFGLRDTVRMERMREMLGEGLRRQDLIRWGIYFDNLQEVRNFYNDPPYSNATSSSISFSYGQQVMDNIINNGNFQYKFLVLPVPQQELNLNKAPTAVQHPLWQ